MNYLTYETHINDCSHYEVREREIQLHFVKDKGLSVEEEARNWKTKLTTFLIQLNEVEESRIKN